MSPDEKDAQVIEEASIRQSQHLRGYQTGAHAELCTWLLNEIAAERNVLLHPAKRQVYAGTARTTPNLVVLIGLSDAELFPSPSLPRNRMLCEQ